MADGRTPVSIITVFNDPEVRRACLDRSIDEHQAQAPETEYIPVDNTGGRFTSAGAALNHGAAQARHEYLVFVHQDVYLHSLAALESAAGKLARDPQIGLLAATGRTPDGRFLGTVRDRLLLVGDPAPEPAQVDCVDELLFMIPRRVLEREPLPEDHDLAWHAYAVEYGLRMRAQGLRVCAVDIPVTHNSLTINLARLEVAYEAVAARHPDLMPVMTPQGRVGGPPQMRDRTANILREHRWRYRWLRESPAAHAGRRAAGAPSCVLADIRLDIDDLLDRLPAEPPLLVLSLDRHDAFADDRPGPLALARGGRPVLFTSRPLRDLAATASAPPSGGPVLITNLGLEDVRALGPQLPARERLLGLRTSIGFWMLLGVPSSALPEAWRSPQATPLGMRPVGR